MVIQSHTGEYRAHFVEDALSKLNADIPEGAHFIIDARVADLYGSEMKNILAAPSVLRIEAVEPSKSLDKFPGYVDHLVSHAIRRDQLIIAIGGGIIQDITCFLAATILRGVAWRFYPTTLLSQADSCIGSKSSINSGEAKNILGTFTPPQEVFISTLFLGSLDERDVRSGVGEMLKVHAIDGPSSFRLIAGDYERLFSEPQVMIGYVRRSLEIKRPYIEEDEFDRGPRNIFNYGHSFGHAIEAATDFAVPHGIGVTMGMDLANWVAVRLGLSSEDHFAAMHSTLKENYRGFEDQLVPLEPFLAALSKDKKNTGTGKVTLILPGADGYVAKSQHANDGAFAEICRTYFESGRTA
ncbi:MAG: 3-dehydroquinate synthase [Rhodospirillales bacterium]|nr:3-dehydroquinate synthase [Rhodospirillales bacterium]